MCSDTGEVAAEVALTTMSQDARGKSGTSMRFAEKLRNQKCVLRRLIIEVIFSYVLIEIVK
ncbi:8933_t:CDS:2 [Gigaspora margarita]|uniref:8933_t:CDS:1 n=1 Tax=Gigaspora margarita TaxID=4874 RepID=A0ABN7UJS0_GIGMA|nr:8933_t:CDS:2 [Gigaspora margarita]